jgi:hypothetical protein
MLVADTTHNKIPRFILCSSGDLKKIGVKPKSASSIEINAVFTQIRFALLLVILELNHGIKNIPLLIWVQGPFLVGVKPQVCGLPTIGGTLTHKGGRCSLYNFMNL